MALGYCRKAFGTDVFDLFTDIQERFRYQERTKNSGKGVGKFWRFAESIFLTTTGCLELDSFRLFSLSDSKNATVTQDDVTFGARFKRERDEHVFVSPILELFHLQNETVLVICKDGSVSMYELDEIGGRWIHNTKTITTLAGNLDVDLVSAHLHRGHGALYWCETTKRSSSDQWSFNVFKKSIYVLGSKCRVTFGEMVSVLRNCPPVNFVTLKDNILLWFSDCRSDHCPPGLCLTIAADGSTSTRVFDRLNLTGTVIRPCPSNDFMKHCVQSLNIWADTDAPHSKVVYVDLITDSGLLVVVTTDKKVSITTQNLETVIKYDIPELKPTNLTYFLIEDFLCIAGGTELVSGRLKGPTCSWNTLDQTVSSVFRNGGCQNTSAIYLRSEDDSILRLTAQDLDRVSLKSDSSILSWNEAYRKRILPLTGFGVGQRSTSNPSLLHSESMPLTLIERCLEGNASPMVSKAVGEHLKEIRKIRTDSDLKLTIGPLVNSYFHLQEHLNSNLNK